jgi:hypothetical protein
MKIKRGIDKGIYAVFRTNMDAEKMEWLFVSLLRRRVSCFNGYDNAFRLI